MFHDFYIKKSPNSLFCNMDLNLIRALPANVYWKNREGYYLGCNEGMIELGLINSEKDFVGTTLRDHSQLIDVDHFEAIDNQIMTASRPLCLFEQAKVASVPKVLTTKFPLFNAEGIVDGLIGISFNISKISNYKTFISLICNDDLPIKVISKKLEEHFFNTLAANHILLSQREKECLAYFRRGRSIREIAVFLKLSTRTVETYINNIKIKFGCNTKAQLLDKIDEYDA